MDIIVTHNYPNDKRVNSGLYIPKWAKEHGINRVCYIPFAGEFLKECKNPFKIATYLLKAAWKIFRIKEESIWAHWWLPLGIIASVLKRNVRVVAIGLDIYWLQCHPIICWLTIPCARWVKEWQCISQYVKDCLLKVYPTLDRSRVFVRYLSVADEFQDLGLERTVNKVLAIGSLIKQKNFDLLVKAFEKVHTANPGASLEIIGAGPERLLLLHTISLLSRESSSYISVSVPVPIRKLVEAYNTASLCILVSDDEGYGMVLREAQVCGCPTIATAGDAKEEIVDYIIPEKTVECIAQSIVEALDKINSGTFLKKEKARVEPSDNNRESPYFNYGERQEKTNRFLNVGKMNAKL